jgi:hypothetical protein
LAIPRRISFLMIGLVVQTNTLFDFTTLLQELLFAVATTLTHVKLAGIRPITAGQKFFLCLVENTTQGPHSQLRDSTALFSKFSEHGSRYRAVGNYFSLV